MSQTNFPLRNEDENAFFQEFNGSYIFSQSEQDNYRDGFISEFDLSETELGTSLNTKEVPQFNENYLIYPNPSSTSITINSNSESFNDLVSIEIFDITGKRIEIITNLQRINNNSICLDVTDLSTGYYNVILNKKTASINLKLIKN